jgi:hypothetical protein
VLTYTSGVNIGNTNILTITAQQRCIFACMASRIENPTATPTFLSAPFPRELLSMLFDVSKSLKSRVAAAKPDVVVYRPSDEIE